VKGFIVQVLAIVLLVLKELLEEDAPGLQVVRYVVSFHPGNHLGGILLVGILNNCLRVAKVLEVPLIT
jgi:hypothetical protein